MKTSCGCCAKDAGCPLQYDEDQYSECPILNADNEPLCYRNSEGYADPTAFFALRNVMKARKKKPLQAADKPKPDDGRKPAKQRQPRTQVLRYDG